MSVILPKSFRPGTDLMSKMVVRNPDVVNIITRTLVNSQDEYVLGESEWNDGTRSDLVLEPKTPFLDLLPIVIEFQHTVNFRFIKRTINYCLKAYDRYHIEPICLIVCIDTLAGDCYEQTMQSSVTGCRSFPCIAWASRCLILSQASLVNCSTLLPLDPFVALGFFLTQRFVSITSSPFNEDSTMKFLYDLALKHYGSVVGDEQHMAEVIKQVCDTQDCMNTRLLELIHNHASPQIITDAIKNSQFQNNQLKRKYSIDEDCSIYPTTSSLNTSQATSSTAASDVQVESATSLSYRQGMEFVENFKKARMEKGLNKMDWVTCLAEERHKFIVFDE
ncbi:hypothetical protein MFLAVUS_010077 [Mucor flavus]|uniref:Uncharacterized protein n=1 Tax=Mucor flavus TaxID=439312 RepID=A0ABP9ZBP5_9FUNG